MIINLLYIVNDTALRFSLNKMLNQADNWNHCHKHVQ